MFDKYNIPNFITAKSPRGLRRLMVQKAAKTGKWYSYYDISFDGKQWVAWYNEKAEDAVENEVVRDAIKK